ncbi:hypothetical protein OPU71_20960 [Niveibacterium sp. 24ML]|uniref:hypothetical protein n=1 Tax=Niveibacterium sp. 24ML TaxID=2985512 RepID=UPI0022705FCB|nr:hypothetical protein [Niveibacterium sp. 24ML]MCX9158591.1 hypothetical protein [Niveibacterium sp. 24ML]
MESARLLTDTARRLIVAIALSLAPSGVALAHEPEIHLRFSDVESLTKWMASRYPAHDIQRQQLGPVQVYSAYGGYGSGIARVDSYFYVCEATACQLLGLKLGTLGSEMTEPANVTISGSRLIIESPNNYRFELPLSP